MGMMVLIGITLVSAFIWHCFERTFEKAVTGATITAVMVFQVNSYFHSGHVDAFILIALIVSAGIAFVVSVVVGAVFLLFRKKSSQ